MNNQILSLALECAESAGKIISDIRASRSLGITHKGTRDLLTQADLQSEKDILSRIRARYPDHAILSEEAGQKLSPAELAGPLWVVDPVDGTTNFAHDLAHVGISIGFIENGIGQVGVVGAPFLGELFHATIGGGAFLNNQRIKAAQLTNLEEVLVATGFPYDRSNGLKEIRDQAYRVLTSCRDIRRLGAASLDICYVACGRFGAYFESVRPWDMAAGAVIAKEAGAMVGHHAGPILGDRHPDAEELPEAINGGNLVVATAGIFDSFKNLLDKTD